MQLIEFSYNISIDASRQTVDNNENYEQNINSSSPHRSNLIYDNLLNKKRNLDTKG